MNGLFRTALPLGPGGNEAVEPLVQEPASSGVAAISLHPQPWTPASTAQPQSATVFLTSFPIHVCLAGLSIRFGNLPLGPFPDYFRATLRFFLS